MPLHLSPLHPSDIPTLLTHSTLHPPGTDLVAPPYPVAWPVSTRSATHTRLAFSMDKQRQRLAHDPSVRFLKIVETDAPLAPASASQHPLTEEEVRAGNTDPTASPPGDIIALARWHLFPSGPPDPNGPESTLRWELASLPDGWGEWPEGFNRGVHDHILGVRDRAREGWIPRGRPCWVLMHLVTRADKRGKGAAGMLVRWGLERAGEGGVGAYLEAGVQGKPIYEKYGFRQVGETVKIDCKPYGVGLVFEMANMEYWPNGGKHVTGKDDDVAEVVEEESKVEERKMELPE